MNPIIQKLNFQKAIKSIKSEDSKPKSYQKKKKNKICKTTLQINIREREIRYTQENKP